MDRLWAPWRMEYILAEKDGDCFICAAVRSEDDKASLVIDRGKVTITVLNRYPYNNGHLLVCPNRHIAELEAVTPEEYAEIFETMKRWKERMDRLMKPHGWNIGVNLGTPAGAGLKDHIHFHMVPRWTGDTNFMPVLASTKVISQHLEELWEQLTDGNL